MEPGAKMRMKEWLIEQIESGLYEGLRWENEEKNMFRIPWKHAAKKDYEQTADAALFKAWAVHKGKHREGKDKADPTMWKTRLRCALNKSTDFREVPDRNQLDITEPYKVYVILNSDDNSAAAARRSEPNINDGVIRTRESTITRRVANREELLQASGDRQLGTDNLWSKRMYCEPVHNSPLNTTSTTAAIFSPAFKISDFRMHVEILYYGKTVTKVTTTGPEGCFIMQGKVVLGNERIYGPCSSQQISFPMPASLVLPQLMAAMNRLLCHLEKGVLLWVAPDGMFIKRFCQCRVYWNGPMAQSSEHPNKLEREKTFKLLDIPTFLSDLHNCLTGKGDKPSYTIELCFGEEYPDSKMLKTTKLIMAKVVPVFAVELLQRFNLMDAEQRAEDTGGWAANHRNT